MSALRSLRRPTICVAALLGIAAPASAQVRLSASTGSGWCEDSGTYCFDSREQSKSFSGLRFITEPGFGTVFNNGKNRIEGTGFGKLNLFGVETNLVGNIVSLQTAVILPGSITFDEKSPIRTSGRLANSDGSIAIDAGFAVGLSVADGLVALGYGRLAFDSRQITNALPGEAGKGYAYLNFQPLSALRAALKTRK